MRKPNLNKEDLENSLQEKQQVPYLINEMIITENFSPKIKEWLLVNLRRARKGEHIKGTSKDEHMNQFINFNRKYVEYRNLVDWILENKRTHELTDWFLAENPDMASLSPQQVKELVDEWHLNENEDIPSNYEPINTQNILYGPKWENPEWNGWTIQLINSPNDLKREGYLMDHCVGGDNFCYQLERGNSNFVSLRDPSNKPHVTIEMDAFSKVINQIQGKRNSEPKSQYKAMIKEWLSDIDPQDRPVYEESHDNAMDKIDGAYTDIDNIIKGINELSQTDEYGFVFNVPKPRFKSSTGFYYDLMDIVMEETTTKNDYLRNSNYDIGDAELGINAIVDLAISRGKEDFEYLKQDFAYFVEEHDNMESFLDRWDVEYYPMPNKDQYETETREYVVIDDMRKKIESAERIFQKKSKK